MQQHSARPTDPTVTARTVRKGSSPMQVLLFKYKPASEPADLYVGTTIQSNTDTYDIKKLINLGGMGSVYKAEAQNVRAPVAIKFLHRRLLTGDAGGTYVGRFEREAKMLSRIDHPNVVKVLGYGNTKTDVYIVTEYLPGKGLDIILAEYVRKRQPMPWSRISNILMQVCDGVAAAHAQSIWHRDIKPSNVIVMKNDHVKLIDFGTAKLDMPGVTTLTDTGVALGTFAYMAPEMLSLSSTPYDGRGDVYGIGAMMYELLSNSKLFQAADLRGLAGKILNAPPQPFTERVPGYGIPSWVEKIVTHALAKNPGERFQSALELRRAIAECDWDGRPVLAPELFQHRRTPTGAIVAAATALALTGIIAGGWHFREPLMDLYDARVAPALRARGLEVPFIGIPAQTYKAGVYSRPQGAMVYEVLATGTEKYLGSTPLTVSFSGAHTLAVKSGNRSRRITVSEERPTATVSFKKHSQRRESAIATEAVGAAADSFEADSVEAENETTVISDSTEDAPLLPGQ